MPLQMVHLMVVNKLVETSGIEDCIEIYTGSIAPDAIHMRSNTTRVDKNKTHFFVKEGEMDLEKVFGLLDFNNGETRLRLTLGYVIHLLTDYYWVKVILPMQDERYRNDSGSSMSQRAAYYNDTDWIDLKLYDEVHWSKKIWNQMNEYKVTEFVDLINREEVERWVKRNINWFEDYDRSMLTEPRYIKHGEVIRFIEACGSYITQCFKDRGLFVDGKYMKPLSK